MTSDSQELRRPFGEYEIESLIGKGSIGKVYIARHRRIGRRVALKVIDADQTFEDEVDRNEFYRRLQREAELCAALQHPNIVTLYEAGYEGDVVSYMATEYIAGESLQSRLKRARPLPLAGALSIAADLLRGLSYAHGQGVIHRDIKPANIMISTEGHAKIADFGIARPIDSSLTGANSLLGTPNYMSPEQVKSTSVTPRSDLFSAGVVMYEMLTGVRPFAAPDLSGILYNVVNLEPPLVCDVNPAVPKAVASTVARLLAKSPMDRYGTAADALVDVEAQRVSLLSPVEYETIAGVSDATTKPPVNVDKQAPSDLTAMAPATVPTAGATPATEPDAVVMTRPLSFVTRPVPAGVFWSVTLLLMIAFAASVLHLQSKIRAQQPQAVITSKQQSDADAKRRELTAARRLASVGKYDQAVVRYDAYLAKYPESATARAERADAQRLLERSIRPGSEITSVAKKQPSGETAKPEDKQPSRWGKFKKWIRGGKESTDH